MSAKKKKIEGKFYFKNLYEKTSERINNEKKEKFVTQKKKRMSHFFLFYKDYNV